MSDAVELATKIVAAFAAILGLAGYVLLLGAAILWLRLHEVDLPSDLPVSLAAREELIVIGAQAVGVWVALVSVLGGLIAWIVTGDPERRHFDHRDASLALAITLATVAALDTDSADWLSWLVILPGAAAATVVVASLKWWPSGEAVAAVLLPVAAAVALGLMLSFLGGGNEVASGIGATFLFAALFLLTPSLQGWRLRQQKNMTALALLEAKAENQPKEEAADGEEPAAPTSLVVALKPPAETRPKTVVWIGRIAIAFLALLVLGVVSVASQVGRDGDLHSALVSLTNGDCVTGTFVTRGKDQLVIAQPDLDPDVEEQERIAVIPSKEILEVQVFSGSAAGLDPEAAGECAQNGEIIVHPKPEKPSAGAGGGAQAE